MLKLTTAILMMILTGCVSGGSIDGEYIRKQWGLVKERQPVIYGEGQPVHEDLFAVINECRNKTNYRTDKQVWQLRDYWATPDEYLMKGAGDCEDTAICNYYKLHAMGFKEVFVVVGLDGSGSHAVTQVKTERGDYVLDSKSRLPIPAEKYIGKWLTNVMFLR